MPAKTIHAVAAEWANKILSSRTPVPYLQDALPELVADARREQTAQLESILDSLCSTWAFRSGRKADTITARERALLRADLLYCLAEASQLQADLDREATEAARSEMAIL